MYNTNKKAEEKQMNELNNVTTYTDRKTRQHNIIAKIILRIISKKLTKSMLINQLLYFHRFYSFNTIESIPSHVHNH